jgi:hypothetical protein
VHRKLVELVTKGPLVVVRGSRSGQKTEGEGKKQHRKTKAGCRRVEPVVERADGAGWALS